MGMILARAVSLFAEVITLFLVGRAIFSWFARDPYSTAGKIYRFLIEITEPVVNPCRRLLERFNFNTGMLDFSVFIAFILVELLRKIIVSLILVIF